MDAKREVSESTWNFIYFYVHLDWENIFKGIYWSKG